MVYIFLVFIILLDIYHLLAHCKSFTTPGQNKFEIRGNEGIVYIPRTAVSQSAGVVEYTDCMSSEG